MFYCETCLRKAGVAPSSWRTYCACDLCGLYGIVHDLSKTYEISPNAPTITHPGPGIPKKKGRKPKYVSVKMHLVHEGHTVIAVPHLQTNRFRRRKVRSSRPPLVEEDHIDHGMQTMREGNCQH
jgi:hypothetical protein